MSTVRSVDISGILTPADWDDSGIVSRVCLEADGEREYLIHDDVTGRKLNSFLRKRVRIEGKVYQQPNGRELLYVQNFFLAT